MTDERALRDTLRGLVRDPYVPDGLADRVADRYGRRRRYRAAASLAGATLATAAVVGVVALTGKPVPPPPAVELASESPAPPLPDGPRVEGSGTVLARPGEPVRFCPPRSVLWGPNWDSPSAPPEPPRCQDGIPVTGVDLAALRDRTERDGAVWGDAWLLAVYADDALTVVEQDAPRPRERVERFDPDPPCAEPAGGWPQRGQPSLRPAEDYADKYPGDVVHLMFWKATVVVAVHEPERAERELRPVYGEKLCVVKTRWTRAQVKAAQDAVKELLHTHRGVTSGGGYCCSVDGQATTGFDADILTPEIEAFLATQPDGLVHGEYWLERVP